MPTNHKARAALEEDRLPPLPGFTLADYITLELVDSYGGPMRISSLVRALRNRGLEASDDGVANALMRSPERFVRTSPGCYELGPLGPLARKRQGRKLRETQR